MGKGDRRGKKPRGIPDLAPIPKREIKDNGKTTRRKRTAAVIQERNPQNTVLDARARQCGLSIRDSETSDQNVKNANWNTSVRSAMRSQQMGDPAGRAIMLSAPREDARQEDARQLWETYSGLLAAHMTYYRVVLGRSPFPKTANIEMEPEVIEARPDDRPDDRTEEEKHRDATNRWMHWQGLIGRLKSLDQSAIWDIVKGRREPMEGGKLTGAGRGFVKSLQLLQEQVDRK